MAPTESSAGAGFQVALEAPRDVFGFQRQNRFELPWAIFGCVTGNLRLMFVNALPQIFGVADVKMPRRLKASVFSFFGLPCFERPILYLANCKIVGLNCNKPILSRSPLYD
jgi:hypothetical protein